MMICLHLSVLAMHLSYLNKLTEYHIIEWILHASIIVEKDSQKGIVIGAGGKRIKDIGLKARRDIEKLLNKHVYLELFVKVQSDWRNNESLLETYGYKNKKQ